MYAAPTRFLVVRHGQTVWNAEHRYAGGSEIALAPSAGAQIARLTRRLRDVHLDAAYTSPLRRCLETCAAAAAGHGLVLQPRGGLRERSLGGWEGRSESSITGRRDGYAFPQSAYDGRFHVPGAEPLHQLEARVRSTLDELRRAHPGATVLLATHAGVMWSMQTHIAANRPHEPRWPGNCALMTVVATGGRFLLADFEEQPYPA